jgi:hypothetical protein
MKTTEYCARVLPAGSSAPSAIHAGLTKDTARKVGSTWTLMGASGGGIPRRAASRVLTVCLNVSIYGPSGRASGWPRSQSKPRSNPTSRGGRWKAPLRGVQFGAPQARRTRDWPLFAWSPADDWIIRFDDLTARLPQGRCDQHH